MKYSLIQMVQKVMSDLDSDSVVSITDTPESLQVASTIEDVYWQFVTDQIIPELLQLKPLETIVLADFPGSINYLKIPDTVSKVYWFQYNVQQSGDTTDAYSFLTYKEPAEFISEVSATDLGATDTTQVTDPKSGMTYHVYKDKAPQFWTTFDDEYIAVDSLDMVIDTVQVLGTKSRCQVQTIPTWTTDDDFIPDIDDNVFPLLLAEAKSTCFVNLKQTTNAKLEGQSRGQRLRLQNNKNRTTDAQKASTGCTGPNFGRRSGYSYSGLKAPNF